MPRVPFFAHFPHPSQRAGNITYNIGEGAQLKLLTLVGDLDGLVVRSDWHVRSSLLGCDSKLLVLKLNESDVLDSEEPNFPESLKTIEYGSEIFLLDTCGNVLHDQGLVGADIFIWNSSGTSLDRLGLVDGSLGKSLGLAGFFSEFAFYNTNVSKQGIEQIQANVPFKVRRCFLWASNCSALPFWRTLASLGMRAFSTIMFLPCILKPSSPFTAASAASKVSKVM